MTINITNSNATTLTSTKSNTPTTLQRIGNFVSSTYGGAVQRPLEHLCQRFIPHSSPNEILHRVSQAAEKGFSLAKARGISFEPVTASLHGKIDEALKQKTNVKNREAQRAAQAGEIADLPGLDRDSKITLAPLPQALIDATDWDKENRIQRENLSKKISIFSTLLKMRDICGIKEENNLTLMPLVKKATEENTSLWQLFTKHYNLSFIQKFKAALFYFFYFQSSFISNVVDAYLGSVIENVTNNLTKEDNKTRIAIFKTIIDNANGFLIADIKATQDFANQTESGTLEDYRNRAIERYYDPSPSDSSIANLCDSFSKYVINKYSKPIPFFKDSQKIPIFGSVFKLFEWIVNRFVIQRAMKNTIVPAALETAVKKGLEATRPENLPFSLSLVRFLNQRLEKLRTKIKEEGNTAPKARDKLRWTEMLPDTVKNLKRALNLEIGGTTSSELIKKFKELDQDKHRLNPLNFYDIYVTKEIDAAIEEGITEAGNLLFRALNEIAQSGELSAKLLEVAAEPFNTKIKDQALMEAEYKDEQSKLERTGKDVFEIIIQQAIAKKLNGVDPSRSQEIAKDSFDDQKMIASTSIDEFKTLCARVNQKIEQSKDGPTQENSAQVEIASMFQIMKVLSSRKELQEKPQNIKDVDQNIIWRALTPLFERIEEIQIQTLELQQRQDRYSSHHDFIVYLKEIEALYQLTQTQLQQKPNDPRNIFIESMKERAKKLESLGTSGELNKEIRDFHQKISELSESLTKTQIVLDAIYALSPPRDPAEKDQREGLLDLMVSCQRGVHIKGFNPNLCLKQIDQQLDLFPAKDRNELKNILGDGSSLTTKWAALSTATQRIYSNQLQLKRKDSAELNKVLESAKTSINDCITKYTLVEQDDYAAMQTGIKTISTQVDTLHKDILKMELDLPSSLPTAVTDFACKAVPVALSYGAGMVGGLPGILGLGVIGGVVGNYAQGVKTSNQRKSPSIAKNTIVLGAAGLVSTFAPAYLPAAALSYVSPEQLRAAGTAVTAVATGWKGMTSVLSRLEGKVHQKVWAIFTRAHKMMQAPRIYKAAVTRALKAVTLQG